MAAFVSGVDSPPATAEAAQAFYERAQALASNPMGGDSARVAKYLGRAFSFCQATGLEDNQAQCLMLLGEALSNERGLASSVEEPAEVELFSIAAEYFRALKNASLTAMFRTNIATAIVRTCGLDIGRLQHARALAEKSYREKVGSTSDRPYSVFAIGMIDAKIAGIDLDSEQLKTAIKKMRSSLRRLKGEIPDESWVRALCEVGEFEARLLEMRAAEVEQQIVRSAGFSWVFSEDLGEDKVPGLLRTNPRVLGVDETPCWLPGPMEIRGAVAKERVSRTSPLLDDLSTSLTRPLSSISRARVERVIGRLGWLLDPNLSSFKKYAASIANFMDIDDQREVAMDGLHAWLEGAELLEMAVPAEVTEWVCEAVLQLFGKASFDEKLKLLTDLSVSMRQLAAFASRANLWQYSREILIQIWESSSGGSWGPPPHKDCARVSLYHDPFDTFIMIEDTAESLTSPVGRRLEISGRDLANGWLNIQDGATAAQFFGSTASGRGAYSRELERVQPLLEALFEMTRPGVGLFLRLFGLFHHIPIASLLEAQRPGRHSFILESCGLSSECSSPALASGGVVLSATPPELDKLRHAATESFAISTHAGWSGVANATRLDLESALHAQDVVHLISHGEAGSVGLHNRLHLVDGQVSSQEILGWEGNLISSFVYLDACQSALDLGFMLWEAQTTIPGMLCRKGVPFTLGTTRKINDLAAAVFAVKFYQIWNGRLNATDIYGALSGVQLWIRKASLEDLMAFNRGLEIPFDLPPGLVDAPMDMIPFQHPACWAPYSLVASEDACLRDPRENEFLSRETQPPSRSWTTGARRLRSWLTGRRERK